MKLYICGCTIHFTNAIVHFHNILAGGVVSTGTYWRIVSIVGPYPGGQTNHPNRPLLKVHNSQLLKYSNRAVNSNKTVPVFVRQYLNITKGPHFVLRELPY